VIQIQMQILIRINTNINCLNHNWSHCNTMPLTSEMLETMQSSPMSTDDLIRATGKDATLACNAGFRLGNDSKEFRDGNNASAASLISDSTSSSSSEDSFRLHYYTRSEIQHHNTESSAWIVAGDDIYDVTDYVEHHPGGKYSIMKKIGGVVDCTQDLLYHSKSGQKYWNQFLVGKVTKNPSKNRLPVEKEWWKFWE